MIKEIDYEIVVDKEENIIYTDKLNGRLSILEKREIKDTNIGDCLVIIDGEVFIFRDYQAIKDIRAYLMSVGIFYNENIVLHIVRTLRKSINDYLKLRKENE
jgi:Flp pilus assembly CpaF family ATPase